MDAIAGLYRHISQILSVLTPAELASLDSSQPVLEAAINKIFDRQITATSEVTLAGNVFTTIANLQTQVAQLRSCGSGSGGTCSGSYNDQPLRDEIAQLRRRVDDLTSCSGGNKKKRKRVTTDSEDDDDDDNSSNYKKDIKRLEKRITQLTEKCNDCVDQYSREELGRVNKRINTLSGSRDDFDCQEEIRKLNKRINSNDADSDCQESVRKLKRDISDLREELDRLNRQVCNLRNSPAIPIAPDATIKQEKKPKRRPKVKKEESSSSDDDSSSEDQKPAKKKKKKPVVCNTKGDDDDPRGDLPGVRCKTEINATEFERIKQQVNELITKRDDDKYMPPPAPPSAVSIPTNIDRNSFVKLEGKVNEIERLLPTLDQIIKASDIVATFDIQTQVDLIEQVHKGRRKGEIDARDEDHTTEEDEPLDAATESIINRIPKFKPKKRRKVNNATPSTSQAVDGSKMETESIAEPLPPIPNATVMEKILLALKDIQILLDGQAPAIEELEASNVYNRVANIENCCTNVTNLTTRLDELTKKVEEHRFGFDARISGVEASNETLEERRDDHEKRILKIENDCCADIADMRNQYRLVNDTYNKMIDAGLKQREERNESDEKFGERLTKMSTNVVNMAAKLAGLDLQVNGEPVKREKDGSIIPPKGPDVSIFGRLKAIESLLNKPIDGLKWRVRSIDTTVNDENSGLVAKVAANESAIKSNYTDLDSRIENLTPIKQEPDETVSQATERKRKQEWTTLTQKVDKLETSINTSSANFTRDTKAYKDSVDAMKASLDEYETAVTGFSDQIKNIPTKTEFDNALGSYLKTSDIDKEFKARIDKFKKSVEFTNQLDKRIDDRLTNGKYITQSQLTKDLAGYVKTPTKPFVTTEEVKKAIDEALAAQPTKSSITNEEVKTAIEDALKTTTPTAPATTAITKEDVKRAVESALKADTYTKSEVDTKLNNYMLKPSSRSTATEIEKKIDDLTKLVSTDTPTRRSITSRLQLVERLVPRLSVAVRDLGGTIPQTEEDIAELNALAQRDVIRPILDRIESLRNELTTIQGRQTPGVTITDNDAEKLRAAVATVDTLRAEVTQLSAFRQQVNDAYGALYNGIVTLQTNTVTEFNRFGFYVQRMTNYIEEVQQIAIEAGQRADQAGALALTNSNTQLTLVQTQITAVQNTLTVSSRTEVRVLTERTAAAFTAMYNWMLYMQGFTTQMNNAIIALQTLAAPGAAAQAAITAPAPLSIETTLTANTLLPSNAIPLAAPTATIVPPDQLQVQAPPLLTAGATAAVNQMGSDLNNLIALHNQISEEINAVAAEEASAMDLASQIERDLQAYDQQRTLQEEEEKRVLDRQNRLKELKERQAANNAAIRAANRAANAAARQLVAPETAPRPSADGSVEPSSAGPEQVRARQDFARGTSQPYLVPRPNREQ
jgi:hypothetical protein